MGKLLKLSNLLWLLFLLSLMLSIFFLRANSQKVLTLKQAVVEADRLNEPDIADRLTSLQKFVVTHMNADMGGPIELAYRYNRDVALLQEEALVSSGVNKSELTKAQDACSNESIGIITQCVQKELLKNPTTAIALDQIKLPPVELYSFEFASPKLSFDLAGLSSLASTFFMIVSLAKYGLRRLDETKLKG